MMDIEVIGVWDGGAFRSKLEMKRLPDDAFVSVMEHLRQRRRDAQIAETNAEVKSTEGCNDG